MKAMLFCAGLGTRLKPITNSIPKALVPVNGIPLLEKNLNYLAVHGIKDVIINIHHFGDKVIQFIESKSWDLNIDISDERDEVLETGGGLKKAQFLIGSEDFVVMNVDILTNLNLHEIIADHKKNKPIATLAVSDRVSSRKLLFDTNHNLAGWKNEHTGELKLSRENNNLTPKAFSGIQVISPKIFDLIHQEGKFSIIEPYLEIAKYENIKGFDHSTDILIDVGKHETLKQAEQLFV